MSEHKRYVRDQQSKKDEKQARFDNSGEVNVSKPANTAVFISVNFNEKVWCPFCLYEAKLSRFLVVGKHGYQQGTAHCPECNNTMRMASLWNDWDAKKYAEWAFDYRLSGFWQKCPFAKWKERLFKIGWAHEFWTRYKALKGEAETDEIFDSANTQARAHEEEEWKKYVAEGQP